MTKFGLLIQFGMVKFIDVFLGIMHFSDNIHEDTTDAVSIINQNIINEYVIEVANDVIDTLSIRNTLLNAIFFFSIIGFIAIIYAFYGKRLF